jgi:general secretion pathway protein A
MDYFKLLNLSKEPFSDSPDPEFYFDSKQHVKCLQKIELSLRMRRGLSMVVGDVGSGKTTLCRQLIRRLANDNKMKPHPIPHTSFSSPSDFLATVAQLFGEYEHKKGASDRQLKKIIGNYLFAQHVDQDNNVVLIIDEGEKLPEFCLEILQEFLNYESGEQKSLQIVIFAQSEFEQVLRRHRGLTDRIDSYYVLCPLDFQQTRAMIRFRLKKASEDESKKRPCLFGFFALWCIYRASGGYPRKIIQLCHQMILALIIKNRSKAGWSEGRRCIKEVFPERARRWQRIRIGVLACSLAASILFILVPEKGKTMRPLERGKIPSYSLIVRGEIEIEPMRMEGATTRPLKAGRISIRSIR